MVKPKTSIVLVTALLLLSSAALAQDLSTDDDVPEEPESDLGEGVLSYNFVMRGLPASNGDEVDVERSFEVEADENENFSISQEEAVQTALDELGSSEWELDEAEQSEGLYELTFVRGESEAEVSVDGSTGRIVEFEAEVEYEPIEESSAVLSGFVEFSNDRFELDTDIEVNEEDNTAQFEVAIEEEGDLGADVVTRESIREFEDAEPGKYSGVLEVVRDDRVVHTERQEFRVPGPVTPDEGDESEDNETEESEDEETEDSDEDENESDEAEDESESLEEMSRDELIEEVRSLREEVERLRSQASDRGPETPPTPGDDSEEPEDDSDEESEDNEEDEQESEDTDDSESEESDSNSSESEGPPSGAPGNSENRPGFVSNMLSGLFG